MTSAPTRHARIYHLILIAFVFLQLFWAGCGKSKPDNKPEGDDPIANSSGSNIQEYKYSELHKVEDFSLVERDGTNLGPKDLEGKVWLVSFFFSTCKFECSDQNRTIRDEVHEKLAGQDFTVVSITCDPQTDTPDVLKTYSTEFTTQPKKWKFLTGPIEDIKAIGKNSFKVIVDPKSHTKRLLMVDKWGRFRDAFEWKDKSDLARLRKTAKMLVAEEQEPAADEIVKTRALPDSVFKLDKGKADPHHSADSAKSSDNASQDAWPSWRKEEWLTSFELNDSNGKKFHSKQLDGKVWVANFFFTSCTGVCPRLLQAIDELKNQLGDRDVTFVSISNDPERDSPDVLRDYKRKFGNSDRWHFLTGIESLQVRAIGSEFFNVNAGTGETHSEKLTVVDKWGGIRGHFHYNKKEELTKLRLLLDDLLVEKKPPQKK